MLRPGERRGGDPRIKTIQNADLRTRSKFATDLALEAGALARRSFCDPSVVIDVKSPGEIVTSSDRTIDQLIADRLAAAFPNDGRISEESKGAQANGLWVIDPIDGTFNFARGIRHFAVSIAFCLNGRAEIGAVFDPMADDLFFARRGHGAQRNGAPIRVSAITEPNDALVELGYPANCSPAEYLGYLDQLLTAGYAFRQAGSAALGLAHVADGRLDAYIESSLYAWDVTAGLLLVREAGGWTSHFNPRDRILEPRPVLASAPGLAAQLGALTGIR
jgi:myo-inositol-1(or 4)-monophosphatase